jgi:hypothetical protein
MLLSEKKIMDRVEQREGVDKEEKRKKFMDVERKKTEKGEKRKSFTKREIKEGDRKQRKHGK